MFIAEFYAEIAEFYAEIAEFYAEIYLKYWAPFGCGPKKNTTQFKPSKQPTHQ